MSEDAVDELFRRHHAKPSSDTPIPEKSKESLQSSESQAEEKQFTHQEITELIAKAGAGPPPGKQAQNQAAMGPAEHLMMKALMGSAPPEEPKREQNEEVRSTQPGPAEALMMKALLGGTRADGKGEAPQDRAAAELGPAQNLMMKAVLGTNSPEVVPGQASVEPAPTSMGPAEELMMKALLGPGLSASSSAKPTASQMSPPPSMTSPSAATAVASSVAAAASTGSSSAEQLMMKALLGPPLGVQAPASQLPAPLPPTMLPITNSTMPDTSSSALLGGPPTMTPLHAPLAMSLPLAQTAVASQVANGSIGAAEWPAPSPQAVQQMLLRFPQLDEAAKSTLFGLPPQDALAILWDLNAKGGCAAVANVTAFVKSAAQTLLQGLPGAPAAHLLQAPIPNGGLLAP